MRLLVLKAGKGDSLLLSWKEHHMLIDSGTPATLRKDRNPLLPPIKDIDLFLLTHIDYDHIGGFLHILKKLDINLFHQDLIFYINNPEIIKYKDDNNVGYKHGGLLSERIKELKINRKGLRSDDCFNIDGMFFSVLSPDNEHLETLVERWDEFDIEYCKYDIINDKVSTRRNVFSIDSDAVTDKFENNPEHDIINATSIAFLAEYNDKRILLLGDSHPGIVSKSLKKILHTREIDVLDVDFVKVSHHGSKHNTTFEFLNLISCNKFIISTDGSRPYSHPDSELISKIIINLISKGFKEVYFYFNYGNPSSFEIINEHELDIKIHRIISTEVFI
ncbi:ComEC/Rec2 family competence protein [Pectobacterium sp. CHL-2024]|uniref:ComEC/Rec2 family competence protein n=1 Tax=Pectobacterium sp. CHL-2024 TaxID=3377079 RepID=UPI0038099070